jgi:hypothetical protein
LAKCAAITQAGTACKGIPIDGSSYCYVHHPDHATERRRHGSRGGRRGGRGRPSVELATLKERLTTLADDVLEGSVDRSDAAIVGQLLNTVIRAIGMEMRVREVEDLKRQVEELREMVEAGRSQRQRSYGA